MHPQTGSRRIGLRITIAAVATLLLTGCGVISGLPSTAEFTAVPYPDGCADYGMSTRRCDAVVAEALEQAGLDRSAVATIELTSEPPCSDVPNSVCTYTTGFAANVRLHLAGGGTRDQQIRCSIGGEYSILCTDTPAIRTADATDGYRDVPCDDSNGAGCATPLPTIEPQAAADARPLEIPSRDIPIDHVGHYVVEMGHAVLPNGILTTGVFTLADPTTQTIAVDPDTAVRLRVVLTDPDAPSFDNYYAHGWHPGTEEMAVTLEFDVTRFDPGAVLAIRDLAVR